MTSKLRQAMDSGAKLGNFSWPESCGDFDMHIARDGTWYYQGSPIGRKELCKLFATVLERDDNGDYWLVTPVERGLITVEDAPFVAVTLDLLDPGPQQILRFRTNLDHVIEAGPDHPIRVETHPQTGEPAPYVHFRDKLDALIGRAAFYQLVDLATLNPAGTHLTIRSKGTEFTLGSV